MKIALSGKKQSGKTTIADYLSSLYEIPTFSFATPLKMALISIGVDPERLFGKKDPASRRLMQVFGQAMRDQDELYWVDKLQYDMCGEDSVVVDDLRMQNEAESLKALGFKLVRVEIPLETGNDGDVSETDLDTYGEWDAVLSAPRGDVEALYYQIDALVSVWEKEDSLI